MPCSPESKVSLESVTLTLSYNTTGVIGGFNAVDDVNGSVTYTRVRLTDKQWLCAAAPDERQALADKLLNPGEFVIAGSACCPCYGLIYSKAARAVSVGVRSFTPLDDSEGGDIPPDEPITAVGTFGIGFTGCNAARSVVLKGQPGSTPVAAAIGISMAVSGGPDRNAEILVQLSNPSSFFSGVAHLAWTGPDGIVYDLVLDAGVSTGRNIATVSTPSLSPSFPDGIVVTTETGGFRIGCSGKFRRTGVTLPAVVTNTLTSFPLVGDQESFSGLWTMFINDGAYLEQPGCGGTNATPCGNSFSASNTHTVGPETWTATMEGG